MFCPLCKAEYREGFHECSDCRVALVDSLPQENPPESASGGDAQAVEKFWSGYNRNLRDQIEEALDAGHVRYTDESLQPSWLPAIEQRTPYEIWILRADHDSASKIVSGLIPDDAVGPDPDGGDELPDSSDQAGDEATPDDQLPDFYPEDATCEVWSGDDKYTAQFLSDCLRGVGIACVVSGDGGKARVLVLPDAETRAREIVHEVVEGALPE